MSNTGKDMKTKYDVIIVGGGIGGLICGCLLAREGLKILILERNHQIGGYCTSFKRASVRFDAGAHIIGSCGKGGILNRILKLIDINHKFYRTVPTDRFFFPNDLIEIPSTINSYKCILQKKYWRESKSLDNFFDEVIKISRNTKVYFEKYTGITYADMLRKYFNNNEKLKSVLSAQAGFLGVIPKEVSAVSMCSMMVSYIKDGAYYPAGGAGSFADSIAMSFVRLGGDLRFMCEVYKIYRKKMWIVHARTRTNDSVEFCSDILVSDIDISALFNNVIDSEALDSIPQVRKIISTCNITPSISALYIAADIKPEVIVKQVGWHHKNYDIDTSISKCFFVSSPSIYDSRASVNGYHVIEIMKLSPYLKIDAKAYNPYKNELENLALKEAFSIFPQLKNSIVMKDSATPQTMERYTNNRHGAAYGWAFGPEQYKRNEMISKLCKPYLYLVGHWTNPGGGIVAVAVSGYNAARKIISQNTSFKLRQ